MIYTKKPILILFISLLTFTFFSQSVKSNENEILNYSTNDHRLHIKGQTFNTTGKVHDVRIRIVHDDGVIDTVNSKNGKYNLHLEMNHKILLEFECLDNKHYIKRIAFNTNVPNNTKKIPYFDLTINLVEKDKWNVKDKDEGIFDLPVAYLNFDFEKKLWYDKNDAYSRIINKKIKSYGIY
tara:strand:+ start:109 stop:651 length:543 start_codon:yes stop_codon:yes gene_type:complete